jgi:hypothetical protein
VRIDVGELWGLGSLREFNHDHRRCGEILNARALLPRPVGSAYLASLRKRGATRFEDGGIRDPTPRPRGTCSRSRLLQRLRYPALKRR